MDSWPQGHPHGGLLTKQMDGLLTILSQPLFLAEFLDNPELQTGQENS